MSVSSPTVVLDDVFEPLKQCLTPEVAERIAALRASPDVQRRIDELADKSSEGTLSTEEQAEYESRVRTMNFIGVLQAKARQVLARQRS